MHEDTQRRLVRIGFVLFCLVPTVLVLGLALFRATPVEARRWERRLREQLGLHVTIHRLTHPRPQQVRLESVVIGDPETQQAILTLPALELIETASGWRIHFEQAALDGAGLPVLWRTYFHRILPSESTGLGVTEIQGDELTVRIAAAPQSLRLHQLQWRATSDTDDHRSLLQWQPAPGNDAPSHRTDQDVVTSSASPGKHPQESSEPVRITLMRDRETTPPVTRLALDTGPHALPLDLLLMAAGQSASLPIQVQGQLPVEWQAGRWTARFQGCLAQIQLESLAADWVPHDLRGLAELKVEHASLDASGLQTARCQLVVQGMEMSAELLAGLLQHKLFEPGPAFAAPTEGEPFRASRLELELLSLGENGLICRAPTDSAGLRIAVSGPTGPVLLSNGHVRADWFIRSLIPEDRDHAYALAARWVRLLPPTLPRLSR